MRQFLVLALVMVGASAAYADSLFDAAHTDSIELFTQSTAEFSLGDIITIDLVENVNASNKADLDTQKESNKDLSLEGFNRIGLPFGADEINRLFGQPLTTDPEFTVDATSDFEGDAEQGRSQRITGTVSAQITELRPNGTMRIEATRRVYINEEENTIVLTGIVRRQDVAPDNTIPSTRVANTEIYYTGRGPLTNTNRRGLLTEILEYLWPW